MRKKHQHVLNLIAVVAICGLLYALWRPVPEEPEVYLDPAYEAVEANRRQPGTMLSTKHFDLRKDPVTGRVDVIHRNKDFQEVRQAIHSLKDPQGAVVSMVLDNTAAGGGFTGGLLRRSLGDSIDGIALGQSRGRVESKHKVVKSDTVQGRTVSEFSNGAVVVFGLEPGSRVEEISGSRFEPHKADVLRAGDPASKLLEVLGDSEKRVESDAEVWVYSREKGGTLEVLLKDQKIVRFLLSKE